MAICSGDTALYAIRRWTLILYSATTDRDGSHDEDTELFQGALKKTVSFGFDQYSCLQAGSSD